MSSQFGLRYRLLSTESKSLISIVGRECGVAVAAELLEHLMQERFEKIDDKFWGNLEVPIRVQIIKLAKANRFTKVGALDLTVSA